MLIETDFLNRDFTEAYAAYYAKTFRRHSKVCSRISFFKDTASFLNERLDAADAAARLEALGKASFLGYIVLRPISEAPLSEALLVTPSPKTASMESYPLVSGRHEVHVAGASLALKCVPMTQQDTRIGACAQAAIWSIARYFHTKHKGPWLTTSEITKYALSAPEWMNNVHLPAGSEFLTLNNMSAALRLAGREPLLYFEHQHSGWNGVKPAEVINRYIDSGIPVLVGLQEHGKPVGHAVAATGQLMRFAPRGTLPPRSTRAEFLEGFYVNDDQLGPNALMPIVSGSPEAETKWTVEDNVKYLLVPLPAKVYLSAEKAEIAAWNELREYCEIIWPAIKVSPQQKFEGDLPFLGDDLALKFKGEEIIARTYLTYGWKYKHRAIRNNHPPSLRHLIKSTDLPRFVYVTEFSTLQMLDGKQLKERRVISHCVVDTTAKNTGKEAALIFHAPGYVRRRALDGTGRLVPSVSFLPNDTLYYPKVRGSQDFSFFADATTSASS